MGLCRPGGEGGVRSRPAAPAPAPPNHARRRGLGPWGGRRAESAAGRELREPLMGAALPGAAGGRRGRRAPGFPAPRGRSLQLAAYLTWP